MKKIEATLDNIKLIQRRFELMTVEKYRDEDRIRRTSEKIDEIRKKVGKGEGETMTEIVRKWRDARYGPSRR